MTNLIEQIVVPPSTSYREIILTQGKIALVDEGDFRFLSQWKWHAVKDRDGRFYASRNEPTADGGQEALRMHTAITGVKPTDHRNNDGLDNRRENLRPCTGSQNCANRRPFKNNVSGYKGVSANGKGYMARIRKDGKLRGLGTYPTSEQAARAYDREAGLVHGEFAFLNFPLEPPMPAQEEW